MADIKLEIPKKIATEIRWQAHLNKLSFGEWVERSLMDRLTSDWTSEHVNTTFYPLHPPEAYSQTECVTLTIPDDVMSTMKSLDMFTRISIEKWLYVSLLNDVQSFETRRLALLVYEEEMFENETGIYQFNNSNSEIASFIESIDKDKLVNIRWLAYGLNTQFNLLLKKMNPEDIEWVYECFRSILSIIRESVSNSPTYNGALKIIGRGRDSYGWKFPGTVKQSN
ncbi:hypothetical protein [Taibaiella soli]|uniref:Uncharacterized protein n=1 Tax=Taibaiella soli TaxID=1649169 RepID=A0A2W2BDI9_9BACT|nr:hypothetical protein [Taibaiella soli]PZF73937.1 hypothetical protein DN068_06245 [Taibaiella soli]